MKKIDQMIREALREEDAELLKEAGTEPSLYQEGLDLFRGRSRWLVALFMFLLLLTVVASVYTAVRFFQATTTREMLVWATAFLTCMLSGTTVKIWTWFQMHTNAVTREIKRLELQVAYLARNIARANDTSPHE